MTEAADSTLVARIYRLLKIDYAEEEQFSAVRNNRLMARSDGMTCKPTGVNSCVVSGNTLRFPDQDAAYAWATAVYHDLRVKYESHERIAKVLDNAEVDRWPQLEQSPFAGSFQGIIGGMSRRDTTRVESPSVSGVHGAVSYMHGTTQYNFGGGLADSYQSGSKKCATQPPFSVESGDAEVEDAVAAAIASARAKRDGGGSRSP